ARRGPRLAAPATVARAVRRDSETRAAPTAAAPVTAPVAPRTAPVGAGRVSILAGRETAARPTVELVAPGRTLLPVSAPAGLFPSPEPAEPGPDDRELDTAAEPVEAGDVRPVAS